MTLRRLTAGETALARRVFGAALAAQRVRLLFHRLPIPFAITLGRWIVMPGDPVADFAAEAVGAQAWLVHELTHVRQFQTAPTRTLLSWAKTLLTGGYGPRLTGYRYPLPFDWGRLNLEQQASVVEDAFLLVADAAPRRAPPGATLADYATAPFPLKAGWLTAGAAPPWGPRPGGARSGPRAG